VIEWIWIPVLAAADRFRGRGMSFIGRNSLVARATYSVLAAAMTLQSYDTHALFIAALTAGAFFAGMLPGWGEVIGPIIGRRPALPRYAEWWQIGPLLTYPWVGAVARGLMWGAPVAAVGVLNPQSLYLGIATALAFPLSLLAGSWARAEWARGALIAGGYLLLEAIA